MRTRRMAREVQCPYRMDTQCQSDLRDGFELLVMCFQSDHLRAVFLAMGLDHLVKHRVAGLIALLFAR